MSMEAAVWPIQSMTVRICLVAVFWMGAIAAGVRVWEFWRSKGSPSFSDLHRANGWLWPTMVVFGTVSFELIIFQFPAYLLLIMLTFFGAMFLALYQYRSNGNVA